MNSLQFSCRRYLYTNFEFWNFPPAVGSAESPDGPGGPGLSVGRAATRHGHARPRAPTLQEKRRSRAELPPLFDIFQTSFSEVAGRKSRQFNWREFHPDFTTQKSGDKFSWIEQKMAVRLQTKTQTSSWTAVFPTETIQSQAQSLAFMKKFTVILW